jgi:hypothetical protein
MEALHLLEQLQRMGIGLTAVGGRIRAAPKAALTDQVRGLIRANKPALLAVLRADGGVTRGPGGRRGTSHSPADPVVWSAEDWQALFDERAGIAEFDGGFPRADAERHAFEYCVIEWVNRAPELFDPNRCAWCRRGGRADHAVLPLRAAMY